MSSDQPGSTYPYEHYEPFDENAALRSQIARTRADLGDTIAELAARTDVKARASEMVADVRSRTTNAVRSRARRVVNGTRGAARSGASSARDTARHGLGSAREGLGAARQNLGSARDGLDRASRSPASIAVVGAGAAALASYGIVELVRRRRSR